MANMSYTKFRNTLTDLDDCYDSLWDEVSSEEHKARAKLVKLCRSIAENVGDNGEDDLPVKEF